MIALTEGDKKKYEDELQAMEREMEQGTYGANDADATKYEISSDEDELPFACFICRNSFTAPIVTKYV